MPHSPCPDELGERLIACGLVPNSFVLDLNQTLSVPRDMELPPPWNLPSRLFQFPIEVSKGPPEQPRIIGLMHPMLSAHPFVVHVETLLDMTLSPGGAPNRHGYSLCDTALWWHAVDLVSAGSWRALLDTRQFTTDDDIIGAVSFGCRYTLERDARKPLLTTKDARTMLRTAGSTEPAQRTANLRQFTAPMPCKSDDGPERWPINTCGMEPSEVAWGMIHGIEDGWFSYRSGHLEWSARGRAERATDSGAAPTQRGRQQSFDF